MRKTLINKVICFCLVISCFNLVSCEKKTSAINNGEWLKIIIDKLNIVDYTQKPYFINIDENNAYFIVVQKAVDWNILKQDSQIDLQKPLTREFVAYTLINLAHNDIETVQCKDANQSIYPDHLSKAVALGLFEVDKYDLVHPKQEVMEQEAKIYLDKMYDYINNYHLDTPKKTLVYQEGIVDLTDYIEEQKENVIILKENNLDLVIGDIISFNLLDEKCFKKINDIDDRKIYLTDCEFQDIFEESDLDLETEIDFNDATIETNGSIIANDYYEQASFDYRQNEIEIKGFKLSYQIDHDQLHLKVLKKTEHGFNIYAETNIYDMKHTVRFKHQKTNIEDAYFKLDYKSNEALGIKRLKYHDLFIKDISLNQTDLLNSYLAKFQNNNIIDEIIPLLTVKFPIPDVPTMYLKFQIQLHMYANGRMEISLQNQHCMGLEIKNNHPRFFNNHQRDIDFIVKGSLGFTTRLMAIVEICRFNILDLVLEGGIKASMQTTVHLYDDQNNLQSFASEIPLDYLNELAQENKGLHCCGDLKLNWVLDVIFNSNRSFMGKIGLGKTFNIINERNGQINPPNKTHLENWHFVDQCTYQQGKQNSEFALDQVKTDQITLNDYALVIKENSRKKIKILGLPEGYKTDDLVFESSDINVAIVSSKGFVSGKNHGNTIITIKTKDLKYEVKCNILISQKS